MGKDFFLFQPKSRIKDTRLNDYSKKYTVDEPLTDAQGTLGNMYLRQRRKNILFLLVFVFIGIGVLFARIAYLQVLQGGYYREIAEGNRIRIESIQATRGVMYDRNGVLLVKNVPNFRLEIVPADILQNLENVASLQAILDMYTETQGINVASFLSDTKEYSYQPITLAEYIPYDTALSLMIDIRELAGVRMVSSARREYLAGPFFSHVLGYTGKISEKELETQKNEAYELTDYIGKAGLELYYEKILRGVDGKKEIEVDSLGKEMNLLAQKDPIAGHNLVLSLDAGLQNTMAETLARLLEEKKLSKAAAVAIDPNNGEILALVTFPTFDNNMFHTGVDAAAIQQVFDNPDFPLVFRPIQGEYPSGSTFKPFVAAAALQEGIITPHTTILSTGGLSIGPWFFPDWKAGGHGSTNVYKALAESVNTFFYMIGGGFGDMQGLGVDRITAYASLFGFGTPLGIDLPSESAGFLPSKEWKKQTKGESWYIGDTYHYAIGQGDLLVTPLQIANATAAIINGGTLYTPHLAKKMLAPDEHSSSAVASSVVRSNIVSPGHLAVVKEGLRAAVVSGSARSLNTLPVTSGGKTGTAQFGKEDQFHSWFVGFAPYEHPEIVITVLVESGGQGNDAALPVARETLAWYFTKKGLSTSNFEEGVDRESISD